MENIQISKEQYEKLYKLAYHDNLTGCYNRNWFLENYSDQDEFLFVIVDINDLKKENDTKGHCAGDKLIKDVATSLMQFGDVVRFGGDEFVLVAPKDFDVQVLNSEKYCYGSFLKDKTHTLKEVLGFADFCLCEKKKAFKASKYCLKPKKLEEMKQDFEKKGEPFES
jgi:GGDEF domain-containing protein